MTRKSTIKTWSLLSAAAVLLSFVGGWFLLVAPQRSEAAELRVRTATLDSAAARSNTVLNQLIEQAKELPAKQAELADLRAKIPTTEDLPGIVRQLTTAANVTAVQLTSIAPAAPEAVPAVVTSGAPAAVADPGAAPVVGLQRVTVSLSVQGNYFAAQEFLRRIEGLSRAVLVTDVALKEATTGTYAPGDVAGTITAHVFFTNDPSSALSAAAALTAGSPS